MKKKIVLKVLTEVTNEQCINAQHHLGKYLAFTIFNSCRETYLKCDEVCEKLSADKRKGLTTQQHFDHPVLQLCYDMISANFRYEMLDKIKLNKHDAEDINLYFTKKYTYWVRGKLKQQELIIAYYWDIYFYRKISIFATESFFAPAFVKHIINATFLNSNNKVGKKSEAALIAFLENDFGSKKINIIMM